MKFRDLDVVRLLVRVPGCAANAGAIGTVVVAFDSPDEAYEVEFVGHDGSPVDICTLYPSQLAPAAAPIWKPLYCIFALSKPHENAVVELLRQTSELGTPGIELVKTSERVISVISLNSGPSQGKVEIGWISVSDVCAPFCEFGPAFARHGKEVHSAWVFEVVQSDDPHGELEMWNALMVCEFFVRGYVWLEDRRLEWFGGLPGELLDFGDGKFLVNAERFLACALGSLEDRMEDLNERRAGHE